MGATIGCGVGAGIGSSFGPVGVVYGLVVGGLIGLLVKNVHAKLIPNMMDCGLMIRMKRSIMDQQKLLKILLVNASRLVIKDHLNSILKRGYEEALKDFESLELNGIQDIKKGNVGKWGTLPDGRRVNVRMDSEAGVPTLEIYNPVDKTQIKIRYV